MKKLIVISLLLVFLSVLFVGIFLINNISTKNINPKEEIDVNDSTTDIIEVPYTNMNTNTPNQTKTIVNYHRHGSGNKAEQEYVEDPSCVEHVGTVTIIPTDCIYYK